MQRTTRSLTYLITIFLLIVVSNLLLAGWLPDVLAYNFAPPVLPARFYGTVTLKGGNVPAGTQLSAAIAQHVSATAVITIVQGVSSYVIDIPGDNPGTPEVDGGREGDTVRFTIPGYSATQQGIWHLGGVTLLDLSLASDPEVRGTATPVATTTTTPHFERPVTIPEPLTVVLLGIGISGLVATRIKQRY